MQLASKFEKSANMTLKKVFFWKTRLVSKNFSLLLMFIKFLLLITFFVFIFLKLFQRIWNQREILRFLISFLNKKKKNFTVIFSLLDQRRFWMSSGDRLHANFIYFAMFLSKIFYLYAINIVIFFPSPFK